MEDRIGGSPKEKVNFSCGEESVLRNDNAASQGVNSASLVGDKDQFEAVSLVNQDQASAGESHGDQVGSNRSSNSDYENCSSIGFEDSPHQTRAYEVEFDYSPKWHDCHTPSPRLARQIDNAIRMSSLGTGLDSGFYADSGYSPLVHQ